MDDRLKLNQVLRKCGRVVTREIVDETLLVPIHGDMDKMQHLFALNPVAAYLWEHLDGERDIATLIDGVCEAFEVEREDATADALDFFGQLLDENLVDVVEEQNGHG